MSKKLDITAMSYEELEKHYKPLIEKFVRKGYRIRDHDSDDLRQEFREVLFKAHTMYRPGKATFITYLYTAFKNRLQNMWRDYGGLAEIAAMEVPINNDMYIKAKDDTSLFEAVGLASHDAQQLAMLMINFDDWRERMPKQKIDTALAELTEVLRKDNKYVESRN